MTARDAIAAESAAGRDVAPYFVQSLARGLDVLRVFGREARVLTLGEVARRTGMSRAAARRYLLTLRDLGYVQVRGSEFALKPRLLELGYAYLSSLSLWEVAQPILEELVASVGETCSVSVLDPPDIVYVARVQMKRIISPTVSIGTRFPAFVTSAGRVMLAAASRAELDSYFGQAELVPFTEHTIVDEAALRATLADVRKAGHAVVDQEFELGLSAVAVPVRDRSGKVIAALNASMPGHRFSVDDLLPRLLTHLKSASAEIAANLP